MPNRAERLPPSTRVQLTRPLHTAVGRPIHLSGPHTVPVSLESWQYYALSLNAALKQLQDRADEAPDNPNDFVSISIWIKGILALRGQVTSLTLALRPFEYFQESQAKDMIEAVNRLTLRVAEKVEADPPFLEPVSLETLTATNWTSIECPQPEEPLSRAFGLDSEDLKDENGEFNPARVFSAYYLQNGKLLQQFLPHLHSLRLPPVLDPLVAVSIVGWIESAADTVGAYCAMDALFNRLLSSSNQDALVTALKHLEQIEPRLRQSRFRANRSLAASRVATDMESAALHTAEGYKRLLEGPVRQYGWLYHCMGTGNWADPPMLTTLRDLLIKDGGWVANVAKYMILTEVRNSEAHESLHWDGINEVFITEAGPVHPSAVHIAAVKADSFSRGGQAAIACYRALSIKPRMGGPVASDSGRSAAWLRAEAHFGTNGLQVIRTNFNSKVAKITIRHLRIDQINPCFQALVCCQVLVPGVQRFEIYSDGDSDALFSVSADALKRTHPIWERAVDKFSSLPLSTFLPANLDARNKMEDPSKAVRSVSWIALDDLLDAVDSNSAELDEEDLRLLIERVYLVAAATRECLAAIPAGISFRLRTVNSLAEEVLKVLAGLDPPAQIAALDEQAAIVSARRLWNVWGPVPRLPGVQGTSGRRFRADHGPRLRTQEDRHELRWRTI